MANEQPAPNTVAAPAAAPVVAPTAPVAPQTAAPQDPSDPIVEVGGSTYHLHGLSVADANRIYGALPADYQRLADHYAMVAKAYEATLHMNLPPGITPAKALHELVSAPRNVQGAIDQAFLTAHPYIAELQTQLGQVMPDSVTRMVNNATDTQNFLDGVFTPLGDAIGLPGRALNAGRTALNEAGGAVLPGITDDQAKAFGTAFAASMFYEGAMRQGMPMFGINPFAQQRTLFWSHLPEAAAAGFDYATMHWPLVKDAWPYIEAAWKFAGQWLSHLMDKTKPEPNFSAILNEVNQGIAARQTGDTSWRGLTESRLREGDRAAAGARVASAGDIAGFNPAERAQVIANGGAIVTQDGNAQVVNPTAGGDVNIQVQRGADGQPITRLDRVGEAAGNILGNTGHMLADPNVSSAKKTGIIVGTLGTGYVAAKVVPPAAHVVLNTARATVRTGAAAIAGATNAATNSAAAMAGGQSHAALTEAEANLKTLQQRETALTAERDAAQVALNNVKTTQAGAPATGNWFQRLIRPITSSDAVGRAQAEVNRLNGELSTVHDSIKGKDVNTWFGMGKPRHIAGAEEIVAEARAAATGSARGAAIAQNITGTAQRIGNAVDNALTRVGVLKQGDTLAQAAPFIFTRVQCLVEKLPLIGGLFSGSQTVANGIQGDTNGAAIRGTETVAIAGTIVKLGARRAFAPVAVAMETGDLAQSINHGDTRGVVGSSTALGTMASFAATGAAIGAVGGVGIFDWATIPAGALAGLAIGGVASIFTKWGAEATYDHYNPQRPATPRAQAPQGDQDALAALHDQAAAAIQRTQQLATGTDAQRAGGTIRSAQTAAAVLPPRPLQGVLGGMLHVG